jgi:hypothetical protein
MWRARDSNTENLRLQGLGEILVFGHTGWAAAVQVSGFVDPTVQRDDRRGNRAAVNAM